MIKINKEKCIGCGLCISDCLLNEIEIKEGKAHEKNTSCFHCGHCIAICPQGAISSAKKEVDTIKTFQKDTFTISPDVLLNFIQFRRSIRDFKDQSVEREKIEKMIEAGRYTATAANTQSIQYYVVTDKLKELIGLASKALNEKADEVLSDEQQKSNVGLCNYAYKWKEIYKGHQEGKDLLFYGAPSLMILTANTRRNKMTGEIDAALAASNMELMAYAQGLGLCYNGFFQFAQERDPQIRQFLGIDNHQKIAIAFSFGYPKYEYQRTVPRNMPKVQWI